MDAAVAGQLCQPRGGNQSAARKVALYDRDLHRTGIQKPDYLATVDADLIVRPIPKSSTGAMPGIGDELHMGWNACSSCHDDASMSRKYLLVPGVRSNNIHVDTKTDPRAPRLHKLIEGDEIKGTTCRAHTRSTVWAPRSSFRFWATPEGRRPAAICT